MLSGTFFSWKEFYIYEHISILVSGAHVVNMVGVYLRLISDQMVGRFFEAGLADQ